MPSQFEPFKFMGLYPNCPLPEYAVGWNSGAIYSSSLNDINVGVPLFWLLKRIKINVEWDYTITVSESVFTSSGNEPLESGSGFLALPPNERICANVNNGDTEFVEQEYGGYFYPFGQNNLYFVFYDLREEFFDPTSSGIAFLVSSYQHQVPAGETDSRYEWREVQIPSNPYDITGTLYVGVYIIEQLGQTVSGTWNITIEEMQFWT